MGVWGSVWGGPGGAKPPLVGVLWGWNPHNGVKSKQSVLCQWWLWSTIGSSYDFNGLMINTNGRIGGYIFLGSFLLHFFAWINQTDRNILYDIAYTGNAKIRILKMKKLTGKISRTFDRHLISTNRHGLVDRIATSHPGGQGSIPGRCISTFFFS